MSRIGVFWSRFRQRILLFFSGFPSAYSFKPKSAPMLGFTPFRTPILGDPTTYGNSRNPFWFRLLYGLATRFIADPARDQPPRYDRSTRR